MRTAARSLLLLTILAVTLLCASASAETLMLDDIGLRYDVQGNESCLSRDLTDEQALAALGVKADIALESMRGDGCYLLILSGDRQISLCIATAPEFIQECDVSELDEEKRAQLLDWVKRERAASGAEWLPDMPDYMLLESDAQGALTMNTLCAETLYLGKLFGFRLDVLGRELTDEDREALLSAAGRTLRLGLARNQWYGELAFRFPMREQADELSALEPLKAPVLSTQNAEMTADNSDVTLRLDPVATILPTNTVTVSGATDPSAKLRIRVNGDSSSSFSPESDGSFTVTGRGLNNRKDNDVAIIASMGDKNTTISFSVAVDLQSLPIALSTTRATTTENQAIIEGVTLPGTNVQVTRNNTKGSAQVDAEGRFSFKINTKKDGNFPFKVKASLLGYRSVELTGKAIRGEKSAPTYQQLVKSPDDYALTDVSLSGTVAELRYENGVPKCVLQAQDGAYLLTCQSLLDIEAGMELHCEGRSLGANEDYDGQACPTVRVVRFTD